MPSSFRTFNSPGGQLINGVSYVLDTSSGAFRPLYTSDLAANAGATTTTTPVPLITGAFGTVLADNPARKGWYVKNLHTGALMVGFSAAIPTTGSLNLLLAGGTAVNDGKGQDWTDIPCAFTGPVSVSGVGGAPVLATVWQF